MTTATHHPIRLSEIDDLVSRSERVSYLQDANENLKRANEAYETEARRLIIANAALELANRDLIEENGLNAALVASLTPKIEAAREALARKQEGSDFGAYIEEVDAHDKTLKKLASIEQSRTRLIARVAFLEDLLVTVGENGGEKCRVCYGTGRDVSPSLLEEADDIVLEDIRRCDDIEACADPNCFGGWEVK